MKKEFLSLAIFALFLSFFAEKSNAQVSGSNPQLYMYRHNGTLGNSPAPVLATNVLGNLEWRGLTAINAIKVGASIKSSVISVFPGELSSNMIFSTSNLGIGLRERMIITESGLVGIGTNNPLFHLDVVGNTHTSGRFYGRIHFDLGEPTELPNTYIDEAYFERKSRAQLGLAANIYSNGGILTLAPGGGSLDRQLFSGGDDGLWTRSQDLGNANAWAAWQKILTSGDINGTPNQVARFLPPGPTSSTLGDSQIFDDGTDVGIGTSTPDAAFLLTVGGDTRINGQIRTTGNAQVDGNASVTGNAAVGGNATVSGNATVNGNLGIGKAPSGFDLDVAGESNFDGRVKIGANAFPTFSGAASYELAVGGGIVAEEVLVGLQPWADYVFESDYDLKPLAAVENFIQKEKHLPGVASAKEIAENGLNLGEMQKTQMEKIEELFLHMIAMEKELNALKAENSSLKAKVELLENRK